MQDMGGAALVLALAQMVMEAQLPVRLRVLVPAVENNVSANAYRPGDVLQTRAGITVEVGCSAARRGGG
jgi:leucyl aminopeptidase